MSWQRNWQLRFEDGNAIEFGQRTTALKGAIHYARAHPGQYVEIWDRNDGDPRIYTRAYVEAHRA